MDKNFRDLLARYIGGQCTEKEIEQIHQWHERIGDSTLDVTEGEKQEIKKRMFQNIHKVISPRQQKHRWIQLRPLRIAATVLILAVAVAAYFADFYSLRHDKAAFLRQTEEERIIITNDDVRSKSYRLADGSTVRLEPSAVMQLPADFLGSEREVHLTGKAFFDIAKDSLRPFYVYSGNVATRVLGTSFFVDAPPDAKRVEVKVITGRVSVFQIDLHHTKKDDGTPNISKSAPNGVVLSPNQKVEYFIEEGHWVTGLVEDPLPLSLSGEERRSSLVFANTPVKKVLAWIHEKYGIEVVTENEHIDRCTFTGDVSAMSLYDMLDVLTNSIGSTYEVKGTQILVNGKGCN